MRIVYLGHFDRSWTTETHVARDLEALGHEVDRVQEPRAADERILHELATRARDGGASLVLWTRVNPLPPAATQLWRTLEGDGIATASYHLDLYRGIRRPYQIDGDPFWTTGTVFTADGDPESQRWFESLGINHVAMPAAIVSDEAVPGIPNRNRYRERVVFVGQPPATYPREWPWRAQLLAWLSRTYGRRFGIYPRGRPVRGSDLNALYATATVVVGDTLCPPGHCNYWSDRVYETVGRGGFLIFPAVPGIEAHFTDGEHLRLYECGDLAGLQQLIDYYLANPAEARAVADKGQAHVREHHTYQHRMRAALDIMGLQ